MLGETIGPWVIERRLGEGGMGTVYVARHQVMGRRAAVKVLRAEHGAKPEMVQRFVNEARAAAAIEHPGIVDVIDVGARDDGSAYLVMELLDGESLAQRLKTRGRLPVDTAVRLTRQIAAALAAAHARGIVHRDLKPDNVFVVPDPETTAGERVKLLDFGIAKLHGELAADAPTTQTGQIFGTPLYMSPEQCRGGVTIDHRADLYALGCMLYEMVTGRPPFRAAGLGDLLSKHMMEAPVPPRQHTPDLPAAIEDVILRLLAKDPAERFRSSNEVIAALEGRGLDDDEAADPGASTVAGLAISETVAATTTLGATAAEISPRPRRARWPVLLGAVVLAAAAAVAIVVTKRRSSSSAPDAGVPIVAPRVEPTLGLAFIADLETASGSKLARYGTAGAWEAAFHDFSHASVPDPPPRWRAARVACAGYAAMLRDEPEAEALLREAATADPTWAIPHIALSHLLAGRGDRDAALDEAHEAQRLAPTWWLPIAAEARVHRGVDQLDDAIEHYRRALQLAPDEPVLISELALVYHAQRVDTEAVRYATRALELDPDMIAARLLLAERALEAGEYDTALEQADRLVAIDPRSASGQLARADALAHVRPDEAADAYRKVVEIERAAHQHAVTAERLAEIDQALANGTLPVPRGARPRADHKKPDRSKIDRTKKPDRDRPPPRSPSANPPDDPFNVE